MPQLKSKAQIGFALDMVNSYVHDEELDTCRQDRANVAEYLEIAYCFGIDALLLELVELARCATPAEDFILVWDWLNGNRVDGYEWEHIFRSAEEIKLDPGLRRK